MSGPFDDCEIVATCWSVGCYGPLPIEIIRRSDGFFVCPMEHDERGPFETLEAAVDHAELDFACTDGGLWRSLEDAEAHAREMHGDN